MSELVLSVVGCALPGVLLGLLLAWWRRERRRKRARREPPDWLMHSDGGFG